MEGKTIITDAYNIMGKNIIGPNEIKNHAFEFLDTSFNERNIPEVQFSNSTLYDVKDSHTLILVNPITINLSNINIKYFRDYFGCFPDVSEPCFYNQDWYLNESFYQEESLKYEWVLIKNDINEESRGKIPKFIETLPSTLLCTYVFFLSYICLKRILWKDDYVWCNNFDNSNDQIYVGRYIDPNALNKNGFSIHRHLSIKMNYGFFNVC